MGCLPSVRWWHLLPSSRPGPADRTQTVDIQHFYRAGRPICRKVLSCFHELRGPAWAVGSYSISQSAGGTSQNIIFKTLRQIGRPALYKGQKQKQSQQNLVHELLPAGPCIRVLQLTRRLRRRLNMMCRLVVDANCEE